MQKKLRSGLRTWIEIDRKAIRHNFNMFKRLISPKTKLLAVVKSNAYGHSLIEFSKEMEKLGADFLGVDSIVEALALRREGIKIPILVLGYTLPEMFERAIEKNISVAISSFESINVLKKNKNAKKIKVHIKVDTGMGRHGFLLSDKDRILKELKKVKNIEIEGLFTHFSSAKNPHDRKYTEKQIDIFKIWIDILKDNGFNPIIHACATSGTILFPEAHFDMVRIGIGLYGEWPSQEIKYQILKNKNFNLKPVMSWKTIIGEIKKIPKDSRIGYDGTKVLEKDSIVAVCPIGYWHGYPRVLSNKGFVLIKGKKAEALGRVCMDIIMVDISNIKNSRVGDEVVILGKSGNKIIKPSDICSIFNGSEYEFLTRINPLIKKFYI